MDIISRARKLRQMIESNASAMTDEEAINHPELLPRWSGDSREFVSGERVLYDGKVYSVLQNHSSQQYWTPMDAPSLFAEVLIPDESVIPEWVQPGSTNPYMQGDKVTHNGIVWASSIDNNSWEPGIYGWEAIK